MGKEQKSAAELKAENNELRIRLQEAEETISSIQSGAVDALIVSGAAGEELYMLRGAERPYRILVESMNEGALSLTADASVIYANSAFIKMIGAESGGIILGSSFRDLVHPDDVHKFDSAWNNAPEKSGTAELRLYYADRAVPVYFSYSLQVIDGEPTAFVVTTDISESKKAEEQIRNLNQELRNEAQKLEQRVAERTRELRTANEELKIEVADRILAQRALNEERERLSVTLASIGDGVIATDVDSRVMLFNGVAEKLTGWTQEEARGRKLVDVFNIINEETRSPAENPVLKACRTGIITGLANHTVLIAKDGTEHSIADSCAPIVGHDGEILGAVLVFRDVTEQVASERLRESLNRISSSISSTLEFDQIMRTAVSEACQALKCDSALIEMREADQWNVRFVEGLPQDYVGIELLGKTAAKELTAMAHRHELVRINAEDADAATMQILRAFDAQAMMVVPVMIRGEVTAALRFISKRRMTFGSPQEDFAKKLSSFLSVALENARLYSDERHIAETLQEALISTPSRLAGVEFGHLYRSATESAKVGGDFYNIYEIGDSKIGVLIGDVAGKGISAATLTLLLQKTVTSFTSRGLDAAEIMSKTNAVISRSLNPSDFVTLFLAIIDTKNGEVTYCNGGHPPGFIIRTTGQLEVLDVGSPIVGAFTDLEYRQAEARMARDDIIVLYTDGVIEARNSQRDIFGKDRLEKILSSAAAPAAARDIPDYIFKAVSEFCEGRLTDDMAILAVSLAE